MKTNTLEFDAQALREKILDLAMRGKLVPQDPDDEPASELLKKNNLKRSIEEPHELPSSWDWITLGSGVTFYNGRAYKKKELLSDDKLTPVLRVGNLFTNSSWYYSDLSLDENKYIDNGDLIYAWSASFGPKIWNGGHVIYHYHIWKLEYDNNVIDTNFLYYFLLDKRNVVGETDLHGSTMKHITKTNMEHLPFPLPPLEEQSRIAAKIAQLFALLRKVESSTQQYAKLQTLLKSKVLDLAMRGKLVKQDPHDEPASVLLEKIKAEKEQLIKEKKIKKSKPLPPITDKEKPFDIPDSWEWVRLGEVAESIRYGYTASAQATGNAKLLRITDIQNNNVNWNVVPLCNISDMKLKDLSLHKKDILIARTGGTIGKNYFVKQIVEPTVFASYLIRVRNINKKVSNFIQYVLDAPIYWNFISAKKSGTGQPNVNAAKLENFIFPIPPLEEQNRIVDKIINLIDLFNVGKSFMK